MWTKKTWVSMCICILIREMYRLWVLAEAVLTRTHNLCFLSRNKKNNVYPCKPQFYYIKVGFKVYKGMFSWWYSLFICISEVLQMRIRNIFSWRNKKDTSVDRKISLSGSNCTRTVKVVFISALMHILIGANAVHQIQKGSWQDCS